MGFEVRLIGNQRYGEVARRLKAVGDAGLGKQLAEQLRDASAELRPAIRASAAALLPHRGGYAGVMSGSLQFRQTGKTGKSDAAVVLRTSAKGKQDNRDVPRVNAGVLRHPVYGRQRRRLWSSTGKRIPGGQLIRNPWSATSVPVGFVDRPVDRLRPEIARRMDAVVDYVADQLGA